MKTTLHQMFFISFSMSQLVPSFPPFYPLSLKLATASFASPQSGLERLITAQSDSSSSVRTMVASGNSYIAFLYTDKQLKDIELFCCDPDDNNSCVLGIDTTFKLCNMWITDNTLPTISTFSAAGQERILCI